MNLYLKFLRKPHAEQARIWHVLRKDSETTLHSRRRSIHNFSTLISAIRTADWRSGSEESALVGFLFREIWTKILAKEPPGFARKYLGWRKEAHVKIEYSVFPWLNWLVDQGPLATAVIFFALDFGILSIMNVIDIFLVHGGDANARPRGHLTFWMVVLVDTIILPLVGYSTIRFWRLAGELGREINPTLGATIDVATLIASVAIVVFVIGLNRESNYEDWTIVRGELNLAGWWHTACLAFFVSYLLDFAIKGAIVGWGVHALFFWYDVFGLFFGVMVLIFFFDLLLNNRPELWPVCWLTKRILGRPINW